MMPVRLELTNSTPNKDQVVQNQEMENTNIRVARGHQVVASRPSRLRFGSREDEKHHG